MRNCEKMSWIRLTVKTVHLSVLLLVCGIGFYSLHVRCQNLAPSTDKKESNFGALTVVQTDEENGDDGVVVNTVDEIVIENSEPFIPTNEWQEVKPGQAIPRGLHVRLNVQTGLKEARLLQEETDDAQKQAEGLDSTDPSSGGTGEKINLDELKKAIKSVKSEEVQSVDMESLREKHQFRSYEELKADMEKMNADIQTDAEVISQLVEQFQAVAKTQTDVTPLLEQLEYYLHQIDNAMLFCDLGAMPTLLRCLNSSQDKVRSEAALVLGSALQSNPKVQIAALESGAMHEVLRLISFDSSMAVRKRALYALSAMVRHFPFAQKRFLELGGLSVLGRLFENKSAEHLQVRAVTLLTDLIKEKELHSTHADADDSSQEERLRQYKEINLQEAVVESGWCSLISSLLAVPEHDSREKVLVAMETVVPVCQASFRSSAAVLKDLQKDYKDLVTQELLQSPGDEEDDGFFQGMLHRIEGLLAKLSLREEL